MQIELKDAAATEAAGAALAQVLAGTDHIIFLRGELGAGKTTLVRGLLRSLGHPGRVPSPTYTLVEPYEIGPLSLRHLDLYRIADPGELEYLGVRELAGTVLIEWPEKGGHFLPEPDLDCRLIQAGAGRSLEAQGRTAAGLSLARAWEAALHEAGL